MDCAIKKLTKQSKVLPSIGASGVYRLYDAATNSTCGSRQIEFWAQLWLLSILSTAQWLLWGGVRRRYRVWEEVHLSVSSGERGARGAPYGILHAANKVWLRRTLRLRRSSITVSCRTLGSIERSSVLQTPYKARWVRWSISVRVWILVRTFL